MRQPELLPEFAFFSKRGVMEVLLCAITALAYIATLAFDFVYDDKPAFITNIAVHSWRYAPSYFLPSATSRSNLSLTSGFYRPITPLWFRINHALFGLNPLWWHFTVLAVHVFATYLVFAIVSRLLGDRKVAWIAGLLFGLHPVHVENVAWVGAVNDALISILLLTSFLAFLRYRSRQRKPWLALSLCLFAIALLTKETAGVYLALIFAYVSLVTPEQYSGAAGVSVALKRGLRATLPYFGVCLAYLAVRAFALRNPPPLTTVTLSWLTMVLTWPSVIWFDIQHLVLPIQSSEFYPLRYVQFPGWRDFFLPLLLVAGAVFGAVLAIRRLQHPRVGWFALIWTGVSLVPPLYLRAIAAGDFVHDRFLYLPSVGFVILATLILTELAPDCFGIRGAAQWGTVAILSIACLVGTVHHQLPWASNLTLFQQGLRVAPDNNNVRDNLANALVEAGQIDRAISLYQEALNRDPMFWRSTYNLGYAYYRKGNFAEAEFYFKRAIQIDGNDADQFLYLGLCQMRRGRLLEALQNVDRAIEKSPSSRGYHFVRGLILNARGERNQAVSEFKLELANHPENVQAAEELQLLQQ